MARCGLHDGCFLGCNAVSLVTLRIRMLHLLTNDSSPSDCSESTTSL